MRAVFPVVTPFVRTLVRWSVLTVALSAAGAGQAQSASASASAPHLDPGRPPASALAAMREERARAQAFHAQPPSMASQAESRLRERFDAADTAHRGKLTRAEAQAGGFGWINTHFEDIDRAHAGEVSFDDVKRYLQARRAPYIAPAGSAAH